MDEVTEAIGAGAPQLTQGESQPAEQSQEFKCQTCGREFGNAIALQTHTIRAHKKFWSTNKPRQPGRKHARLNLDLTCPLCRQEFKSKVTLGAHIRKVHGRSAADFPGFRSAGNRTFKGRLGMSATAALKLRKGKSLECPICHNTYANRDSLRTHIRALHHQSTTGLIPRAKIGRPKTPRGQWPARTCPVCSRTYSTRGIMGQHLRTAHGKSLTEFKNGAQPLTPEPMESRQGAKNPKHKRGSEECPVCHLTLSKAYLPHHMRSQHGKTMREARREQAGQPAAAAPTQKPNAPADHHTRNVLFCPVCGTNIQNVQTAVNFGG